MQIAVVIKTRWQAGNVRESRQREQIKHPFSVTTLLA
jgi:hypothetical protein